MKLITLLFLLSVTYASAQEVIWQKTFGGSDNEYGESFCRSNDGGIVVVGASNAQLGAATAWWSGYIVKLRTNGEMVWEHSFSSYYAAIPRLITTNGEGGFTVIGSSAEKDSTTYPWVATLNVAGTLLSEKQIKTLPGSVRQVIQTSDGGYALISDGTPQQRAIGILRLDLNGNKLWQKVFSMSDATSANITETADGGFAIVGTYGRPPSIANDMLLIRVSETGDSLWTQLLGTSKAENGRAVYERTDGNFVVIGTTYNKNNSDIGYPYSVLTDKKGILLDSHSVERTGVNTLYALAPTSDGQLILAGESAPPSAFLYAPYLVKMNQDGIIQWEKRFDATTENGPAKFVRQNNDGTYLIVGDRYRTTGNVIDSQFWIALVADAPLDVPMDNNMLDMDLTQK